MVLLNNVPPQYAKSRTPSPKIGSAAVLNDASNPFYGARFQTRNNLNNNMHGDNDNHWNSMAPQRTASLGPRRPPPAQVREPRKSQFNRMAAELKSSLDELDKLIDDTQSQLAKSSARKSSPKFDLPLPERTGSVKRPVVAAQERPQVNIDDCPPTDGQVDKERFQWEIDLMEWKASSSVNDLRSMFEPSKLSAGKPQKPPASASPSAGRRRPLWPPTPSSEESARPAPNYSVQGDNTIRRTTSTSTSLRPILRNPYRSQY